MSVSTEDLQQWAEDWSAAEKPQTVDANYYFNSYAHFGIHEDMISDVARTSAYQRAIMNNAANFAGKIVLDVGAGSGILSMFAAKAGAAHVYALECSGIVHLGRKIVERNGLTDKITFIQGKAEEVVLPVEKVDIIISEWMGYFLIYESMLDTVIYCRDKWLVSGGLMFPDRATIHIAALEDYQFKDNTASNWDNVWGYDLSMMKTQVLQEAVVDLIPHRQIVSDSACILDIDLTKVTIPELDFESSFKVKFKRQDIAHAFVTWFDTFFPNDSAVLSTACNVRATHWKQTAFMIPAECLGMVGDEIEGSLAARKSAKNPRDIDVKIKYAFKDIPEQTVVYRIR
jgi:type I protein arginine methyltransferase